MSVGSILRVFLRPAASPILQIFSISAALGSYQAPKIPRSLSTAEFPNSLLAKSDLAFQIKPPLSNAESFALL